MSERCPPWKALLLVHGKLQLMRWFKLPLQMHLTASNIPSTLDQYHQYPLRMDLDFTPQMGLSGRVLVDFFSGEVVAAPQTAVESSLKYLCHLIFPCSQQHPPLLGAQPGTPVRDVLLQASQTSRPSSSAPSLHSTTLARARQFDDDARGQKRAAEDVPTPGRVSPTGGGEHSQASEVPDSSRACRWLLKFLQV